MVRLWLDDVRDPVRFGRLGWLWVKTYDEAVDVLATQDVEEVSLDHDLTFEQTLGQVDEEKTGYDVVLWMEERGWFPPKGATVHSANPSGSQKMVAGLKAICRRQGIPESMVRQQVAYDIASYSERNLGWPAE